MRFALPSFFVLAACLAPVLRAQEKVGISRVTEVTVFADRAMVTREAAVRLDAGVSRIELGGLPTWIDPASIRARLNVGEVLDVQTRKQFLAKGTNEELNALEASLLALQDEMALLEDQRRAIDERLQQVMSLRSFSSEKLPRDIVTCDIPVAYLRELVDFADGEIRKAHEERRALAKQQRELRPNLEKMQREAQELRRGSQLEQLHLTITLRAEKAGDALLHVRYQLPGATWEPVHEVRIRDGNQVTLVSLAHIRQTTGEDWDGARLSLSTRQPGQAVRIPRLESLLIGKGSPVNPVNFNDINPQSWEAANNDYLGNGILFNRRNLSVAKGGAVLDNNWSLQMAAQRQSARVFQTLEARGTTALYEVEGRHTVRTDGDLVRVPFASQNLQGKLRVLAAPEISLNAARSLEITYAGDKPLLPGAAALFVDGAYIGNTALDFAGAGETLLLFAGTEDGIKLTRKMNHDESELKRGRRSNRMVVSYLITVENTGTAARQVTLADRIPVSNDRDIRVDSVRMDPAATSGEDGLIKWDFDIAPKSKRSFTLRYQVEYPSDLRRPVAARAAPMEAFGGVQFEMAPAAADESIQQILDLEKTF